MSIAASSLASRRTFHPLVFQLRTLILCASVGCGFGLYDGSADPNDTSSSTGVPDAGQWWPFVCADGSNPSPDEAPESYAVAGGCGTGTTLTLNVDGCELFANWNALGLTDVSTTVPTSTPALGGWQITASPGADAGWTCTASAPAAATAAMVFTCVDGPSLTTACESTLTPVGGS